MFQIWLFLIPIINSSIQTITSTPWLTTITTSNPVSILLLWSCCSQFCTVQPEGSYTEMCIRASAALAQLSIPAWNVRTHRSIQSSHDLTSVTLHSPFIPDTLVTLFLKLAHLVLVWTFILLFLLPEYFSLSFFFFFKHNSGLFQISVPKIDSPW